MNCLNDWLNVSLIKTVTCCHLQAVCFHTKKYNTKCTIVTFFPTFKICIFKKTDLKYKVHKIMLDYNVSVQERSQKGEREREREREWV